jgi:hypothetical protein
MNRVIPIIAVMAVVDAYPLCVVQEFWPQIAPSLGNGTVIARVSDCPATDSGVWCKFDGLELPDRFSFLAEIVNETHVACATPMVDFVGRTRFGISGAEHADPIEWFGFRFDPMVPNTYELIRQLYEQDQIYREQQRWPTYPEGTNLDDIKNANIPILTGASRSMSLIDGGPNVVLNVTNIIFDQPYHCVWRTVEDGSGWQVIAKVSGRPYYPNQVICDLTPAVSIPVHAILLLYMRGRPVRGPGIPFEFVANQPRKWTSELCTHPDGLCSIPNSGRTRAGSFVDELIHDLNSV